MSGGPHEHEESVLSALATDDSAAMTWACPICAAENPIVARERESDVMCDYCGGVTEVRQV
jgi:hypothetical protein